MLPGLAITNQPLNDAPSCAARSCLLFTQCDLPSLDAPSFSIFLYQRVTGPVFLQHGASTPPPPPHTSQDHRARPLQLSCLVSRPAPEDIQSGFTVGAEMPHVQPKPVCFFQEFDLPLHDALSFNVFLCQREPGIQGPSTRRDQGRGECVFRRSSWMLLI